MRCPRCHHLGRFDSVGKDVFGQAPNSGASVASKELFTMGHRVCPNASCRNHVFVAINHANTDRVAQSYPPETITFNASRLSSTVLDALSEGVSCHAASCFKASA